MSASAMPNPSVLRGARIKVPKHVVYRSFPAETVVLNLRTGRYHGLNHSAGRMLEVLESSDSLLDAAGLLAKEYGLPSAEIERDLCDLCKSLLDRDLIEVEDDESP